MRKFVERSTRGLIYAAAACKLDTLPSAPHHTDNLKTAPNTTGSYHLYNTLELLMMGIMVPETCWASSKICNKYHLLHLVGILFPHSNTECFDLYRSSSGLFYNVVTFLVLCIVVTMGVKLYRSRWGRNVGWGCSKIGCWGEYLGLRGSR